MRLPNYQRLYPRFRTSVRRERTPYYYTEHCLRRDGTVYIKDACIQRPQKLLKSLSFIKYGLEDIHTK